MATQLIACGPAVVDGDPVALGSIAMLDDGSIVVRVETLEDDGSIIVFPPETIAAELAARVRRVA